MFDVGGLTKRFGSKSAVGPLSLSILKGHTSILIGPSGCGKSTFLRLLNGLLWADEGEVRFGGEVLCPDNLVMLRRRIGYVIQSGGLFPHLSARRNVTLVAHHLGWTAARCEARIGELIELTHFPADGLDRYPAQLSGGQRQRVSLMRALMLDPDVLLLDEPLAALDPMIRSELQEDLRRIFRQLGKTVVFVTHDMGEAGFLGDVIFLMREGRIVQEGTLEDLVRHPANPFVTRFINAQRSPLESMNSNRDIETEER